MRPVLDTVTRPRFLVEGLAFCAVALLTSCGGGGGGDGSNTPPPSPSTPFTIQSTTPADGAGGVSRTATFSATLSAAASAPTVNAQSVTLKGPEGNLIPAQVTSSGTGVTLTPSAGALPGDTTYTVTFASTIQDLTGRTIGGKLAQVFATSSPAWRATVIDVADTPEFNSVGQPAIAYDALGNLLVAWRAVGPNGDTLHVARMNVATGNWSATTTLETVADGAIGAVNLTCGRTSDCYLAWTRWQSGGHRTARMARFDGARSTWVAPLDVPLDTPTWDVISVQAVFGDGTGLALLATTAAEVVAVQFDTAAQTWGSRNAYVFSASTLEARAVMDPLGNISAVWVHDTPLSRWVYGNRYDARTGLWSAEQPINDALNTAMDGSLNLSLDGTNTATVLYTRGGFISEAYASRLSPVTGLWGAAARLDNIAPNTNSAARPVAVGDAAGNVTAVWGQNEGLWSSRFSPATGKWGPPTPLSATFGATRGTGGTFLSADVAGNVTATWSTNFGVRACRWLVKDGTWGPMTDISVPNTGTLVFTSQAMQSTTSVAGDVATAWYQRNDVGGVPQYKLEINTLR